MVRPDGNVVVICVRVRGRRRELAVGPRVGHPRCRQASGRRHETRARHRRQRRHRRGDLPRPRGGRLSRVVHANRNADAAQRSSPPLPAAGGSADGPCSTSPTAMRRGTRWRRAVPTGRSSRRQQCRHPRRRRVPRRCGRSNGTRVIDVSLNGFFNVTQPLMMPMMRTRWGSHRQRVVGRGACRQSRPGQLRGGERRAACGDQVARARKWRAAASPSTRSRPGSSRAAMSAGRVRQGSDRAAGADEARGKAGRGGGPGGVSRSTAPRT